MDQHPLLGGASVDGSTLDVLVVAYRSEETIPALLESVRKHLPLGSRVAIWSNSDPAVLRNAISRESELHIEVLGSGENLGFARACNALAAWSDRENLLFLNPDAVLLNCPSGMSLDTGALKAPLVLDADWEEQESYGIDRTIIDEFMIRLLRRRPAYTRSNVAFQVGFVSGAAFLARRNDFLRVGGFDETYFMYYEDIDLGRRWIRSGGQAWVEPSWCVRHIGGVSAKSDRLMALQRSQISAERFHAEWSSGANSFRVICVVEALLKSVVAMIFGRVGMINRRTQFAYTKWLLRRWRVNE